MNRLLTLILALSVCLSAFCYSASAETTDSEYGRYSEYMNSIVVEINSEFDNNKAAELAKLAKETGAENIIIKSNHAELSLAFTKEALDLFASEKLGMKITVTCAKAVFTPSVLAEIASKTEKTFEFALSGGETVEAYSKCDAGELKGNITVVCDITNGGNTVKFLDGSNRSYSYVGSGSWGFSVSNGNYGAKLESVEATDFTDCRYHWAHDYVNFVSRNGFFNGTEADKFSPDRRMTRGMAVTVLSRIGGLADLTVGYPYTDVASNAWFASGVSWAYSNGIVEASEKFRPDDSITRLELINMLYNFAEKMNIVASAETTTLEFNDTENITDERSLSAIAFCTGTGIINGYSRNDGTVSLRPDGFATRAEVATMIERFVKYAVMGNVTMNDNQKFSEFIKVRSDLTNVYNKLKNDKSLNISYFGGSVTAGYGASNADQTSWRGLTYNWFRKQFPDAKITMNNAAMGGSGSHLGAFRVKQDIIDTDPDLVFVEVAINDYYSGTANEGKTGFYYESVIRQIREALPKTEIIAVYVTDQGKISMNTYHQTAADQEKVCEFYGVSSVDVGRACKLVMNEDVGSSWNEYFKDGVHPLDKGYAAFADAIIEYLGEYLFGEPTLTYGESYAHSLPDGYAVDGVEHFDPKYVVIDNLDIFDSIKGFTLNSDSYFMQYSTKSKGYIVPTEDENSFTYTFEGTALDMYLEFAGGKYYIEYTVDGGEPVKKYITDTNHPFKLVSGLENGKHTITYSYKGETGKGGTNGQRKIGAFMVTGVK